VIGKRSAKSFSRGSVRLWRPNEALARAVTAASQSTIDDHNSTIARPGFRRPLSS